jgi:hypothetical protein
MVARAFTGNISGEATIPSGNILSEAMRQTSAFATLKRSNALEAARFAHEKLGLEMTQAKALSYHITREPGACHRCSSAVAKSELICASCRSANLDW